MQPVIDHIAVTVSDLSRAERFYDRLLPLLGFDLRCKTKDEVPEHAYRVVEYNHGNFSFAVVNPRRAYATDTVSRRRPGAVHHIAFRADSPGHVDALFGQVKETGARIVHPPQRYPEYSEEYYAFFFKDSENIEYEIVWFDRAGCSFSRAEAGPEAPLF